MDKSSVKKEAFAEERPKKVVSKKFQISTDEEIFDHAKINPLRLNSLVLKDFIEAVLMFAEALSGFKLYPYERDLAYRIVYSLMVNDGATITSLFARQSGKSSTLASIIPALAIMLPLLAEYLIKYNVKSPITDYSNGFWCGIYGPDYERAGIIGSKIDSFMGTPRARTILADKDIGMTFPEKLSSYIGYLPRNSQIRIKSANKKVSIEGDTWHLVVTDETQEINSHVIKKSIRPMLSSTNGTKVHLGSAYSKRVYFYDICKINKEEDLKRPKSKRQHFEVPYTVAQKYNKKYAKYIVQEKKELGENSDEFRMSYELYWPLEKGMFITESELHSRLGRNYSVCNYDTTNNHAVGLDLAKENDSTVLTIGEVDFDNPIVVDPDSNIIRHNKKIKNWLELTGDDYDAQFYLICDFLENFKWYVLTVDATGVGSHMYDRLYNKYNGTEKFGVTRTVIPFIYTRPDKSMGYTLLYKEILSEPVRLTFPDSPAAKNLRKHGRFISQMSNLVKTYEGGYMVVNHSDVVGLDDYSDSLMLMVYGAEENIIMEAEEAENADIYRRRNRDRSEANFWKNRN